MRCFRPVESGMRAVMHSVTRASSSMPAPCFSEGITRALPPAFAANGSSLVGRSSRLIRDTQALNAARLTNKDLVTTPRSYVPDSEAHVPGEATERVGETIVALSSGSGRSAVAVIRISGPKADEAVKALLKPGSQLPKARYAVLRSLCDPESHDLLDKALVVRFPGPASFTGEDVVEIQGHGGPAVVRSLLLALTSHPGVRLAEAGEFTRQAFMAGKLDLTEVEGIADLLAAETRAQHKQALQQTSGVQKRQYERWRSTLLGCLAHVEAVIDFGDDNDIESGVAQEVLPMAKALRVELEGHLRDGWRGELLRDGVRVALVGPPNAGKSTLLNRLAGREAAIVSPTPGTTRDALEVALDLGGQKVIVTDTAGLRETGDAIEAEGVLRAQQAAKDSHIVLAIVDASSPVLDSSLQALMSDLTSEGLSDRQGGSDADLPSISAGWGHDSEALLTQPLLADAQEPDKGKPTFLIINKWDLVQSSNGQGSQLTGQGVLSIASDWLQKHVEWQGSAGDDAATAGPGSISLGKDCASFLATVTANQQALHRLGVSKLMGISASRADGIDLLIDNLQGKISSAMEDAEQGGYMITRMRHRAHVSECVEALRGYEAVHEQLELASEELRYAARALGKVTGAIDTEDILDAIFSEFCVGK